MGLPPAPRKLRLVDLPTLTEGPECESCPSSRRRRRRERRPGFLPVDESDPSVAHLLPHGLRRRVVRQVQPAEEEDQVNGVVGAGRCLPRIRLVDQVPIDALLPGRRRFFGQRLRRERETGVVDEIQRAQFAGCGTVGHDLVLFAQLDAPVGVLAFEGGDY